MKSEYITPSVTLFSSDGSIDLEGMKKHFEFLITSGIDGILILGSIGEFFSISMQEKKKLIQYAAEYIEGRVQLIVGTSGMKKDEILELTRFSHIVGADASIILPPYYFPLSEERIECYFDELAEELSDCPMYLYNFPDRTGYTIPVQVILRLLSKHKNIIGIKDTQSKMDYTIELIKKVKRDYPFFKVYSGFDDNFAHNILSGGDGCIGGLSNVVPGLCYRWVQAFEQEDLSEVFEVQKKINGLMEIYQLGVPFVPYIKGAMAVAREDTETACTFPLMNVSLEDKKKAETILKQYMK